jgi:DNA-binding response OmpR family regulator
VVNQRHGSQIAEFLRAGATDCVRWPVPDADEELLARVEVRLTRNRPDVRLDAAALTLTCRDVHTRLTPTEFKIVHYLVANSERWSTSDEMTTAALRSARASVNLLRVHIYSVRRKLKHEAWRILTNRTFGYRFDISSSHAALPVDESHAVE